MLRFYRPRAEPASKVYEIMNYFNVRPYYYPEDKYLSICIFDVASL